MLGWTIRRMGRGFVVVDRAVRVWQSRADAEFYMNAGGGFGGRPDFEVVEVLVAQPIDSETPDRLLVDDVEAERVQGTEAVRLHLKLVNDRRVGVVMRTDTAVKLVEELGDETVKATANIIKSFLRYSWADINYEYARLTETEKKLASERDFNNLAQWVKGL